MPRGAIQQRFQDLGAFGTSVVIGTPDAVGAECEGLEHAERETAGAAMSVNLSLSAINQGEVVKKLAGWAALLAAPTLITSWYGMNFRHMPELEGRYSYAVVIGVVIVTCVGLYRYLKKVRWL